VGRPILLLVTVILENRVAYSDALIANIGARIIGRRGDELSDDVLTFVAEGTTQGIIGAGTLHGCLLVNIEKGRTL